MLGRALSLAVRIVVPLCFSLVVLNVVTGVALLFVACAGSQWERAEDAWCADVKRDVGRLESGRLRDSAMAAELACDAEEAFEKDGGR